jgi:prephenate dehydrogenase
MIGIIGYGRFSQLMARYLARDFTVYVYKRAGGPDLNADPNIIFAPLVDVCRQKFVIPAVPISAFGSVLSQIAPLLSEHAVVADVCSVKEYPVGLMKNLLPPKISIVASHPMFGPDSAAKSLSGCKIVLCPTRIRARRFAQLKAYLKNLGLEVIETTAEEHDRQIAVSLSLTHFIGRSLSKFGATPLAIDTEGYKRLLHILEVVENDTWQLFEDMHRYNPYAAQSRSEFQQAMQRIEAKLSRNKGIAAS